jgi:pimeloyl-ACP methyl ester carboxylesterase
MEYRGFGVSEGEASHERVVLDARRAFQYLVRREDVRDQPLLVMGQSYGAQLAINIAANYPEEVAALIIEGAFTSFRDIAIHSTPWIAKPFTWAFFRSPYSSTELIKEASMPKLVIHSQDDDVVPFFMGQELFDQAGGQKEFWTVSGQHADALVDYPDEFVLRVNGMAGLAGD